MIIKKSKFHIFIIMKKNVSHIYRRWIRAGQVRCFPSLRSSQTWLDLPTPTLTHPNIKAKTALNVFMLRGTKLSVSARPFFPTSVKNAPKMNILRVYMRFCKIFSAWTSLAGYVTLLKLKKKIVILLFTESFV
jgi:hypothetical protein